MTTPTALDQVSQTTTPPTALHTGLYAVTLLGADLQQPGRIAGRIEHVPSGRRHDFDDGAGLLACLALEQQAALATVRATARAQP